MYDDDPQWRVMFNYLEAMYHAHPVRQDVAGTVESIAKITPELLYRCYNTFYNLGNMVLALAGNFQVDRVLEVCDRMLKPAEPLPVKRIFPFEPDSVVTSYIQQQLPVASPLFQFGFKEPRANQIRTEKDVAAVEVLMETLASDASPLFRDLLDRGLVNEASFSYEYFEGMATLPPCSPASPKTPGGCKVDPAGGAALSKRASPRGFRALQALPLRGRLFQP